MASKEGSKAPSGSVVLNLQDVVPYRGQYGGGPAGGALFTTVRSTLPLLYYSLLAPSSSPYSLASRFPNWLQPQVPQGFGRSIPGVPNTLLKSTAQTLGLAPYPTMVFIAMMLSNIQFIGYATTFRQEMLPLQGPGSSAELSTVLYVFDTIQLLLFTYGAVYNPSWSETLFEWSWIPFLFGFTLQFSSDLTKWLFKRDPRNKGKVLTSGLWGIVRHPNYVGITIWRPAMAFATGGGIFGVLITIMFSYISGSMGRPALEAHMEKKYGPKWEEAKKKVPYIFIPGIY